MDKWITLVREYVELEWPIVATITRESVIVEFTTDKSDVDYDPRNWNYG